MTSTGKPSARSTGWYGFGVIESSSPNFPRLSHVSTFTSGAAAHEIWEALGVPERMGMAQVSTNHCSFPASLRDEVE